MKILLADDDSKIHLIVQLWLRRNGHDVVSVYNGRDALTKLREGDFDGLITDVNMPLLKGVDLVKQTLLLPLVPRMIIVLTSRCDLAQLKQDLDDPRVHIFNKPFSPSALAELIESLSRKARSDNEYDKARSFTHPA